MRLRSHPSCVVGTVIWDDDKFVAFDFETSGTLPEYALQPWRVAQGKSWATSLVSVRKIPGGLDVQGGLAPTREMMAAMLHDAIDNKRTLVGWNTAFDISWLLAYGLGDLVAKAKWLDGMLLWRHYFIEPEYDQDRSKKKSYGLKTCVEEVMPRFAGYQEDVNFHSTDPADLKRLHDYNIRDSLFTLRLTKHWYSLLTDAQRRNALIEAECLPLVAEATLEGMVVDTLAASELAAMLEQTARAKLQLLAPHGVTEKIVRSPIQLAQLMYDTWGLPVIKENTGKKTGKVSRSTDKEALHELAIKDPRAKELRAYREALNNKTKFADTPLASVTYNEDGRTRPAARVFGTYTGRLTYDSKQGRNKETRQTGFALHQEKRDKVFREIIQVPPGYSLVEFDASGQEFRWMAIASGDQTMLALCEPGEDPHGFMGARVSGRSYLELVSKLREGEPAAKDQRQLGKVGNLSLQYRTSARKFCSVARVQYGMDMVLDQARHIHATYQQTYLQVPIYWERQIALTRQTGYVETFAGRRVQVRGNWDGPLGWAMGSTAINYRIQGTGADQKYLALAVVKPYLVRIGARFAWDLHDGIYFWVPDQHVQCATRDIRYLLNNLPYRRAWGFTPPIALPWDCKVGKSWGGLKEMRDE